MARASASAGGRKRRRVLRIVLVALALAVLVSAGVAWFIRDSPRRWLEGRLEHELQAEVSLGGLDVRSQSHYVLTDLVVRQPAYEPRLARVSVERLEVDASLREILRARYDRLVADGVEVRLAPTDRTAVPAPESTTLVRLLEVRRGRIVVDGPEGTSTVDFTAHVEEFGASPRGRATLSGERVELGPWLALFLVGEGSFSGAVVGPSFEVEIGPGPVVGRLTGRGDSVTLGFGERRIGLGAFTVEATATESSPDEVRVEARPVFDGVESAFLMLDVDSETRLLLRGAAELSGISLSRLLSAGEHPLAQDVEVEGVGRIEIETSDGAVFNGRVEADLASLAAPFGARRFQARDARAAASCEWRRGETRLGCTLEGGADGGSMDGAAMPHELLPLAFGAKGELDLAGSPHWNGTAQLRAPGVGVVDSKGTLRVREDREVEASLAWGWSGAPGAPALRRSLARFGVTIPEAITIEGRPRATGTLEGTIGDPALRARVDVAELGISTRLAAGTDFALGSGTAHAILSRAAGAERKIEIEELETRGDLRVAREGAAFEAPLVVSLHGTIDADSGETAIDDGVLTLGDLARARFSGQLAADRTLTAHATLDPLQLEQARAPARPWLGDVGAGYALAGTIAGEVEGSRRADGTLHASGKIQFDQLGFSSEDGSRVVQGGKAGFSIELDGNEAGAIEARATGDLVGPVLLWGTLFGDYSSFASRLELGGTYDESGSWGATADWALPEGVQVAARLAPVAATDPAGGLDYGLKVEVPDLGALLATYVQKPFEGSVRAVDRLDAAGRVLVDVSGVLGDARAAVRGNLAVADAALEGPGSSVGVAIDGLDLDLPIDLEWSEGSSAPAGEPHAGNLRIEKLRLGGADLPPVRTPLAIAADTVRLDRPLSLEGFGGHVELQQLSLAEWTRASRHLSFGLVLDDLELEELSDAFGLFPLEGRVNGEFPAVRLTPERLEVAGGGGIDVFGGRVEIFDISGREVLGRYPRIGFSARYSDVHLLDVTRTVDFGEIEGVVEGEIRDCELFRGTPVRCAAEMHSVERHGVSQRISVKAIRNISILGSGNRVGLLDRGLQSFFKNYTYAEIGIEMTLADDRFLMRGTARRGEKELFLKGRLPFRIDIVNVAPGNAVSFQSMLARLANLEVRPMPPPEREGK